MQARARWKEEVHHLSVVEILRADEGVNAETPERYVGLSGVEHVCNRMFAYELRSP